MTLFAALKWFGTLAGMAGAIVVAAHVSWSGYGYLLFLASGGAWVVAGLMMREPAIWTLNGVFTAINLFGIWRWLLIQ